MTSPEQTEVVQKSSVKVVRNAKREPQWEIKVVAGDPEEIITEAREIAVRQYQALERDLG